MLVLFVKLNDKSKVWVCSFVSLVSVRSGQVVTTIFHYMHFPSGSE